MSRQEVWVSGTDVYIIATTSDLAYLQFGGGSTVISANSFWMRFAEVERAFDPLVALARSLFLDDDPPVPVEAEVDAIFNRW